MLFRSEEIADHSCDAGHSGQTAAERFVEESFQELLELIVHHYRDRPEVTIFELAYMSGMTDLEIERHGVKDEDGQPLSKKAIERRRKAMLEFLKRRVRDDE